MRLAERLVLGGGATLITLVVVELGIHVIESRRGPLFATGSGNALIRPHPVLRHEHVPNGRDRFAADPAEYAAGYKELRTNNRGLRENEDTGDKAAGVSRILTLGDSQTDGFVANEDTWPHVLEQALNRRVPPGATRYEVLNAGVVAYQPMHAYLWWRLYGRQLHPDLVVLGYFTGNDLVDAADGRLARTANGWQLDDAPRALPPMPRWHWLRQRCRLCALAVATLRLEPIEAVLSQAGLVTPLTAEQRAAESCPGCLWTSLQQTRLRLGRDSEYQQDLEATEEILRRLRDDVESTGARLLVLILPSRLQIEGDPSGQAAALAAQLNLALPPVPFEDRVRGDIIALCARNGLATLDISPVLRESYTAPDAPLYYAHDWHLNVRGNHHVGNSVQLQEAIHSLGERRSP